MEYFLIALKEAVSNETSEVSKEIHILPFGEFTDGEGQKAFITRESLVEIVANFMERKNDVVIDYEHQTLTGSEAPAAGWIKKLTIKEDGLWGTVEWTQRGEERIRSKEYRYLSPVAIAKKKDSKGRLIPFKLHSAALTNDPAIDGLTALAAKDGFINLKFKEKQMEQFLEKLAKALGLDAKSTEEQVVEAVVAAKAKAEKTEIKTVIPKEVTSALDLEESASSSEVEASILAMKQGAKKEDDSGELKKLQEKVAKMEAVELVAKAMNEGKVTGDQKDWAEKYAQRDPDGFQMFVAKAPKVVPMGETTKEPETRKEFLDQETEEMAAIFGNSKEDLVKFGGLEESK